MAKSKFVFLRKYGTSDGSKNQNLFYPKRKYSQVFLKNKSDATTIVKHCLTNNPDVIIEIGPGRGILTKELLATDIKYIGIEIDDELSAYLTNKFVKYPNFTLIQNSVLTVDFKRLITRNLMNYHKLTVVSNMPYNITGPLLMTLCEVSTFKTFDKAVLMMQKEVADRILAEPGIKKYGRLTVVVKTFLQSKLLRQVPKEHFFPIPKVDSTVIEFSKTNHKSEIISYQELLLFFRHSFVFKRKTIFNNLKKYYQQDLLQTTFEALKINPAVRAETLTWNQLYNLYQALKN